MKKRILGRTGLEVSELSLGAAFATRGEEGFGGAKTVIFEALELGLNLIDTSADYGDSEAGIGEAIKDVSRPCIISTKLGPRSKDFDPKSKKHLRAIVEESLRLTPSDFCRILILSHNDHHSTKKHT